MAYSIGAKIEAWSRSNNSWCPGIVESVDGEMVFVKFRAPSREVFRKGIPKGHSDLRLAVGVAPSQSTSRPGSAVTPATPQPREDAFRSGLFAAGESPQPNIMMMPPQQQSFGQIPSQRMDMYGGSLSSSIRFQLPVHNLEPCASPTLSHVPSAQQHPLPQNANANGSFVPAAPQGVRSAAQSAGYFATPDRGNARTPVRPSHVAAPLRASGQLAGPALQQPHLQEAPRAQPQPSIAERNAANFNTVVDTVVGALERYAAVSQDALDGYEAALPKSQPNLPNGSSAQTLAHNSVVDALGRHAAASDIAAATSIVDSLQKHAASAANSPAAKTACPVEVDFVSASSSPSRAKVHGPGIDLGGASNGTTNGFPSCFPSLMASSEIVSLPPEAITVVAARTTEEIIVIPPEAITVVAAPATEEVVIIPPEAITVIAEPPVVSQPGLKMEDATNGSDDHTPSPPSSPAMNWPPSLETLLPEGIANGSARDSPPQASSPKVAPSLEASWPPSLESLLPEGITNGSARDTPPQASSPKAAPSLEASPMASSSVTASPTAASSMAASPMASSSMAASPMATFSMAEPPVASSPLAASSTSASALVASPTAAEALARQERKSIAFSNEGMVPGDRVEFFSRVRNGDRVDSSWMPGTLHSKDKDSASVTLDIDKEAGVLTTGPLNFVRLIAPKNCTTPASNGPSATTVASSQAAAPQPAVKMMAIGDRVELCYQGEWLGGKLHAAEDNALWVKLDCDADNDYVTKAPFHLVRCCSHWEER